MSDSNYVAGNEAVPKLVKDRLIRIETRLVKYQESNVVALDDLTKAVESLAGALQEVLHILAEGCDDEKS